MSTKHIALLRGINVSGKNKLRMADLKSLFEGLGCSAVTTYLQSGNVVFENDVKVSATAIEFAIRKLFGLEVPVLCITGSKLAGVSQSNPFLLKGSAIPPHCYVTFLWESVSEKQASELSVPVGESGRFSISDDVIFVHCPDGYGRTKINNNFFEKKLALQATTRNWKTTLALLDLCSQ